LHTVHLTTSLVVPHPKVSTNEEQWPPPPFNTALLDSTARHLIWPLVRSTLIRPPFQSHHGEAPRTGAALRDNSNEAIVRATAVHHGPAMRHGPQVVD
jgi:hypothetical protein